MIYMFIRCLYKLKTIITINHINHVNLFNHSSDNMLNPFNPCEDLVLLKQSCMFVVEDIYIECSPFPEVFPHLKGKYCFGAIERANSLKMIQ